MNISPYRTDADLSNLIDSTVVITCRQNLLQCGPRENAVLPMAAAWQNLKMQMHIISNLIFLFKCEEKNIFTRRHKDKYKHNWLEVIECGNVGYDTNTNKNTNAKTNTIRTEGGYGDVGCDTNDRARDVVWWLLSPHPGHDGYNTSIFRETYKSKYTYIHMCTDKHKHILESVVLCKIHLDGMLILQSQSVALMIQISLES